MAEAVFEPYTVYVDISAKIEAWEKDSVIAVANGHAKALWVPLRIKLKAAELTREHIPHEPVQFMLMAMFAYLAIRAEIARIKRIVIDQDYSGIDAERAIRRRLIKLIQQDHPKFKAGDIRFANIAGSRADVLAREAYRGNVAKNGMLTLAQIEATLRKM